MRPAITSLPSGVKASARAPFAFVKSVSSKPAGTAARAGETPDTKSQSASEAAAPRRLETTQPLDQVAEAKSGKADEPPAYVSPRSQDTLPGAACAHAG